MLNAVTGLGGTRFLPLPTPPGMSPNTILILGALQFVILAITIAFGEEYGWRGYLQKEQAMIQLIPMFIGLPFIGFWVWMLVDMTNNKYISPSSKTTWMLAFLAANIFAAAYYYIVEYRPRHL